MSLNAAYSAVHPDSPIARGWDIAGPVRVGDKSDLVHAVGSTELRRAYGLGIISASSGLPADVHQVETGLRLDLVHPADYLVWWVSQGLQWADQPSTDLTGVNPDLEDEYESARLARIDQYAAELVQIAPVWFVDWLARLIHPPKWVWLVEQGAHIWLDGDTPRPVDADWFGKMVRQWQRRFESAEIVTRVTEQLREVF